MTSDAAPLVIDCDDCIGPTVGACDDCVVTFLCDREPGDAVIVDVAELRALRMLADADLVPRLRHRSTHRIADADDPLPPSVSAG